MNPVLLALLPIALSAILPFLTQGTTARTLKRTERLVGIMAALPNNTASTADLKAALEADFLKLRTLSELRTARVKKRLNLIAGVLFGALGIVALWLVGSWVLDNLLTNTFTFTVFVFVFTLGTSVTMTYLAIRRALV